MKRAAPWALFFAIVAGCYLGAASIVVRAQSEVCPCGAAPIIDSCLPCWLAPKPTPAPCPPPPKAPQKPRKDINR